MPPVLTLYATNHVDSPTTNTTQTGWVHQDPNQVGASHYTHYVWRRRDWLDPVGRFYVSCQYNVETSFSEGVLEAELITIPELHLGHQAALLLLQGQRLSDILIPNNYIAQVDNAGGERELHPLAHLVLNVDPWVVHEAPPVLRNLRLAQLVQIPDGVAPDRILAALVQHTL